MIERKRKYAKQAPSKNAHKIYIICEGDVTEPGYFEFFTNLSSNLELIILPPKKGQGNDPFNLMKLANKEFDGETKKYTLDFKQRDMVWFVVDTDRWEREGKIAQLRQYCATKNEGISSQKNKQKPYVAWNVAQSNPCFEIWLYYHLYKNKPKERNVQRYKSFKEFVSNSISGGFNMQKDPVNIDVAIKHSNNNYTTNQEDNPAPYCTEMHLLGEKILDFVKTELNRLKAHK